MTIHSDSTGARPADEARPNWSWLQERIDPTSTELFGTWLDSRLVEMEASFSDLITIRSRRRAQRSEFARDRSRS